MAVRDDFTAGEVLAAADLNDTFASKVDYALPVNAQTGTTYTFVAADAEKLTTASNAAAVTLTIPPQSSVTWSDNTVLRVVNYGAGAVTIDGGSGVTVTNTSSTIAQYGAAVAIRTGSDAWTVVPFGGGDVPSATVSSPAATGQYTDGGGQTWDYYTFTSSGTLTVDTAGFVDVLVIGGGGAGSSSYPGGGAGGYVALSDVYLPAASHTITVGAGGSANAVMGNASKIGNLITSVGGGPGNRISVAAGKYGGSGGGASNDSPYLGGTSTPGQGNDGGNGTSTSGGGGGGAGAAGSNGTTNVGGSGGAGSSSSIDGSATTRAGGGGGGGGSTGGAGGAGGGGTGSSGAGAATGGTANTGGGGGGSQGGTAGTGGSGIVIVRVAV